MKSPKNKHEDEILWNLTEVCQVCLYLFYIYMNTHGHAPFSDLNTIMKTSWAESDAGVRTHSEV